MRRWKTRRSGGGSKRGKTFLEVRSKKKKTEEMGKERGVKVRVKGASRDKR